MKLETLNQRVVGSNPTAPTIYPLFSLMKSGVFYLFFSEKQPRFANGLQNLFDLRSAGAIFEGDWALPNRGWVCRCKGCGITAKNGALLAALNDTLTETHFVDKRISDLLSDLAEWDHNGDAEEARALLARNENIAGQVADLIEEHIAIANTPIADIQRAFGLSADPKASFPICLSTDPPWLWL